MRTLSYGLSHPCQFNCSYCRVGSAGGRTLSPEMRETIGHFDFAGLLRCLEDKNQIDLATPIEVAAGEITINPKRDAVLDALKRYPVQILSNGAIYNEKVAALIARQGSFLHLSLDAGTHETFRRIKGVDMFDQVISNIKRYRDAGGNVHLKYIVTNDNCDDADIDGFIRICRENGIGIINIAGDVLADHDKVPQTIVDAAVRLAKEARAGDIIANILPLFGEKTTMEIQARIAKISPHAGAVSAKE